MELPTATPLFEPLVTCYIIFEALSAHLFSISTYAAVLAICPNNPGPCEPCCCGFATPVFPDFCNDPGMAVVEAGRVCCGVGFEGRAIGRLGARPPPDLPPELRGILMI
jgi:hypothetical protein